MTNKEEILSDIKVQINSLLQMHLVLSEKWPFFDDCIEAGWITQLAVAPDVIHVKPVEALVLARAFTAQFSCLFTRTLDQFGFYQWETEFFELRLVIYANESFADNKNHTGTIVQTQP